MQKQWSEAGEVFKVLRESDVISSQTKGCAMYHGYAEKGTDLPIRSPLLAGVLSTIVPGSGRLYTGRLGDAHDDTFHSRFNRLAGV